MAKVFLSYDRDDTERARPVALALEKAGHTVWWDRHIRGGAQFNKQIEEALERAEAVVVLWSEHSVESAWVRDEAAVGRDKGRLVPARIDRAKPPLGFRQFQTIDLSGWKRRPQSTSFQELLASISSLGVAEAGSGGPPQSIGRRLKLDRKALAALVAIIVVAAGYFAWAKLGSRDESPAVAVASADSSPVTGVLTRDLFVKLGNLQATQVRPVRIVDADGEADLVFRVSAQPESGKAAASLDLLSTQDNVVLWSRAFAQPSGKQSDLQQQIAFTAARVLDCTLETRDPTQRKLERQTIKLYLNGCAQLDEIYGTGARSIIPVLLAVTQKAPKFKAAWGKLLLAEAAIANASPEEPQRLRLHIAEARKLDPNIPEATIAELALLPLDASVQSLQLLDRAKLQNPDNALILSNRGEQLRSVGRMREGIEDTKRAVELDPLSPSIRSSYVLALANAGRIDAARQELQRFELLWPGTGMLQELQFRFHLRFGDPNKALQMARSLNIGGENQERFLVARANPMKENIDRMVLEARRDDPVYLGFMLQALGEFHRDEQSYQLLASWPNRQDIRSLGDVWFRPALKGLRSDPRFMKIASEIGLLAYWKSTGKWPDFCFERDLPYDCKKEAAKLAA